MPTLDHLDEGAGPHAAVLDLLARDFTAHGGDLKRLVRTIVLTRAYPLSFASDRAAAARDPENRWRWRMNRRRLDMEALRDALLAVAGTLNPKTFGPPVVPPLGKEELTGLFDTKSKWPVTKDPAEHTRRSVYLLVRRTFTYPLFAEFDPPEVMTSCGRRFQTVVPTQALALWKH